MLVFKQLFTFFKANHFDQDLFIQSIRYFEVFLNHTQIRQIRANLNLCPGKFLDTLSLHCILEGWLRVFHETCVLKERQKILENLKKIEDNLYCFIKSVYWLKNIGKFGEKDTTVFHRENTSTREREEAAGLVLTLTTREYFRGKYHYPWPPVWLVWNQLFYNWQFLFSLAKQQDRLIQTSQIGGQWYSHTPPFSIPWFQLLSRTPVEWK